jgi:hypothetical protein
VEHFLRSKKNKMAEKEVIRIGTRDSGNLRFSKPTLSEKGLNDLGYKTKFSRYLEYNFR